MADEFDEVSYEGEPRCQFCDTMIEPSQVVLIRIADGNTNLAHRVCVQADLEPAERQALDNIHGPVVLQFTRDGMEILGRPDQVS